MEKKIFLIVKNVKKNLLKTLPKSQKGQKVQSKKYTPRLLPKRSKGAKQKVYPQAPPKKVKRH